jgi:hypothetical protein
MKDSVEYKRSNEIPGLVLSEARFQNSASSGTLIWTTMSGS